MDHLADPSLDAKYFHHLIVLALTNKMVNEINDYVMFKMPGDSVEYLSVGSISKTESLDSELAELFSVEFLNTINCSGLPNHKIIVLRKILTRLLSCAMEQGL